MVTFLIACLKNKHYQLRNIATASGYIQIRHIQFVTSAPASTRTIVVPDVDKANEQVNQQQKVVKHNKKSQHLSWTATSVL